jgi:predicted DNA-binding transcriptional regulator AlpA
VPEKLLTAKDVAEMLGVKPRTVYDLVGLVRTPLLGRGTRPIIRWSREDVERYIQECRRESAA